MTDAGGDPLRAVRDAEAAIRPVLEAQLRDAVESEAAVRADLRAWSPGGPEPSDAVAIRRAAARQANVLTNAVRFRAALGRAPPDSLHPTPVTPFRGLAEPASVRATLDDLGSTLQRSGVDAGLLGARYAEVLADEERRTRGQFYTPGRVAELVVRWTLDGGVGSPRVLDPAAGTGTFPLAVYDALRQRDPEADLGDLLSRLVAVDLDDVALHLAALRLSGRTGGGPVETFDRRTRSFFDLEPEGDVAPVDAVVGNPPFVRAGSLSPDRDHFREHLAAFDSPAGSYTDGDRALSRRSDASVYFVTHATRFLRPGGRLGMVLPAKWLESDYGVGFRRFLVDQYRIHAVVGFDARAFDALVDTVLLLAERRERPGPIDDGASRDAPIRFVRLDARLDVADSLELLGNGGPSGSGTTSGGRRSRIVARSHSTFAGASQCSPYLRAPEALLPMLDHPAFVPLGELASVSRGVTTGANRFFLLDAAERARWGIDDRFLRPALRSIRGVDARTLTADHVGQSILDVRDFLEDQGVHDWRDGDPTERAKTELRDAGHDGLADYVEHAEAEGWHEGRTCQTRRVWFDLGPLPTPDAFVPKLLRERVFAIRNRAGAVPSNAIDCLSVRDGVDPDVLLGVLDSSLVKAMMEVWGRDEAGLLQLMTYETRTLPVPDVRAFSAGESTAIRDADAPIESGVGEPGPALQGALDRTVLDALDLDFEVDEIRRLRERLLRRRVDGGDRVEVPVS